MTATGDALAERLESVSEIASLVYNKMVENMRYGLERMKDLVEKEAEEEEAKEQQQDPAAAKEEEEVKD